MGSKRGMLELKLKNDLEVIQTFIEMHRKNHNCVKDTDESVAALLGSTPSGLQNSDDSDRCILLHNIIERTSIYVF